jgi:hypothetical protein
MNDVDCLRLKRNYAWWIFTGASLTFEEFENSALSPVLHHFNDHSQCGTWCHHRNPSQEQGGGVSKTKEVPMQDSKQHPLPSMRQNYKKVFGLGVGSIDSSPYQ